MDIITHNVTGDIGVKVYNMTGILVDQFVLPATNGSRHSYTLNNYPSGIYQMVFSRQEGIVTKKVVITI